MLNLVNMRQLTLGFIRKKRRGKKKGGRPPKGKSERPDMAFADPPYGSRMLDRVIDSWREGKFARVLAVEHASDHELPAGAWQRTFDDTTVTIYRKDAGERP